MKPRADGASFSIDLAPSLQGFRQGPNQSKMKPGAGGASFSTDLGPVGIPAGWGRGLAENILSKGQLGKKKAVHRLTTKGLEHAKHDTGFALVPEYIERCGDKLAGKAYQSHCIDRLRIAKSHPMEFARLLHDALLDSKAPPPEEHLDLDSE